MRENEVLNNALNCEEFRKRAGYRSTPVRHSDSEFPIVSCIMWQSSLAACGHVGVATRAGGVLFVTRRGVRVPATVS